MFPHIHERILLSIKHEAEYLGIYYNSVLKYANEIAWSVKYILPGFYLSVSANFRIQD